MPLRNGRSTVDMLFLTYEMAMVNHDIYEKCNIIVLHFSIYEFL
jgi:hypothetical protein